MELSISEQQRQQPLLDAQNAQNAQNVQEEGNAHKFQTGTVYRTIEDFNKQAKHGQDACGKLLECLSNLPEMCLTPCSMFSLCLSIIVLLLYLGGIIWASIYDIYEIEYYDENKDHQSTSIILDCDESKVISNDDVCKFYGFESCVTNDTDTNDDIAWLNKFELDSMVFIKIQFFIAWAMWARVRWLMKDMAILSINYAFLVVFCNIISYMFRHLGWIYYSNNCKIMYSPYFSDDFVHAIISFIISFFVWVILVGVCLKRQKTDQYGNTKLVLRWKGNVIDRKKEIVDNWSVVANVAIYLFFAYAAGGSSLWIGIENYEKNVEKFIAGSSDMESMHYTTWMSLVEWLLTTIVQYFVPTIQWVSIYIFAAMATNLLLVVDIYIFFLKLIRDLVEKIREKKRDRNRRQNQH